MKFKYYFIIILFFISCSEFSETLKEDFIASEKLTISDFDIEYPVINLTVDEEEYNYMYKNFREDIEIQASLNLYRNNMLLIADESVEIEIKGSYSSGFDLKSLGVKFDNAFNNSKRVLLNPKKVLSNHSIDEIKAFRLRNSGNDFTETMLKDISYTQLAINAGLNLDLTYSEPAIVFINESFLGLMNLRSEGNTSGVSRLYKTDNSHVTLAKINNPDEIEKKDGDYDRIDAFVEAIEAKNLSYVKKEIDIDNFIDYVIFHTYIANIDWPYNNVRFYAIDDGPFRFVVYDLDWVNIREIENHPLEFIENPRFTSSEKTIQGTVTKLFKLLYYEDELFKTAFNNRYEEVIESNVFSVENFESIVDENVINISPFMPYQIDKYSDLSTMLEWYTNLDLLRNNYIRRDMAMKTLQPLF